MYGLTAPQVKHCGRRLSPHRQRVNGSGGCDLRCRACNRRRDLLRLQPDRAQQPAGLAQVEADEVRTAQRALPDHVARHAVRIERDLVLGKEPLDTRAVAGREHDRVERRLSAVDEAHAIGREAIDAWEHRDLARLDARQGADVDDRRAAVFAQLPERRQLGPLEAVAVDVADRTLGVTAPQVRLRFHPTTDDYERATGRAWFTSGAIVNNELHLLPLAVLRDRGVLQRTIRHELVHAMADSALGTRAAWVREGAAIYFAGEPVIPGEPRQRPAFKPEPRASCPDDNELQHPVSVGALSNAYARARACFAKQIQAGRTWREVR